MADEHKISHDRVNGIGCGSCAAMNPKCWRMNVDGKADLMKSTEIDGWEHKERDQADMTMDMECAYSCPVNVIHVSKDEKKLI